MQIEGYTTQGEHHETDEFYMLFSAGVIEFLREEAAGGNRKHVLKLRATLVSIQRNGLQGMNNSTLFVREGKFPSGQAGMSDIAVYAAKAFQLRVYGGIVRVKHKQVFLCCDKAIKKKDKADRAQLEKVAKILGEYNER
jgi:hypothetical protein